MKTLKIMLIKLTLVTLLWLLAGNVFAHPGGHYHKGDVLNSWTLTNGQIVMGNFSKGYGDQLVLEQLGGKLIYVSLQSLSAQDQLLARFKINKFKQLNEALNAAPVNSYKTELVKNPQYLMVSLFFSLLVLLIIANVHLLNRKNNSYGNNRWKFSLSAIAAVCLMVACKKSNDNTTAVTTTTIPITRVTFLDSAFAPYTPFVTTAVGTTYYTVASNGLPAHNIMAGITNWQQQVPTPQFYAGTNSWSIPLQSVYATTPMSTTSNFMKGAVALAVNGVPIFNALNNRGEDSYLIGELDNWGALWQRR